MDPKHKTVAQIIEECLSPSDPLPINVRCHQEQFGTISGADVRKAKRVSDVVQSLDRRTRPAKHTSVKMPAYFCRICQKDFKVGRLFVAHVVKTHADVKNQEEIYVDPWRCRFCPQVFATPAGLSAHIKSDHQQAISLKTSLIGKQANNVQCKICGAALMKSHLVKHTLKVHGAELSHLNNDVVKDPRTCNLCSQWCSGEKGLRCHLYWTHGKGVEEVDGDEFKSFVKTQIQFSEPHEFQARKRTKTEIDHLANEIVKWKCAECQAQFDSDHSEKLHRDLHHSKVQCPTCWIWCAGRLGLTLHDNDVHC